MNLKIQYKNLLKSYDGLGILSSSFCAIHCLLAPILFTTVSLSGVQHNHGPIWYMAFDILFFILSLIAVIFATHHTTIKWIKIGFYVAILLLFLININHIFHIIEIYPYSLYIVFIFLISLHILNFILSCNRKSTT